MSDYRLIWFQHFHKAAGTSVVRLARENGETFFPAHKNANPYNESGFMIPLWTYSGRQLLDFVDLCESRNVTFVATEYGCPHFAAIAGDPRVVSVTLLRDPFARMVSSYEQDLLLDAIPKVRLGQYLRMVHMPHCTPNYYVNLITNSHGANGVRDDLVEEAAKILEGIDFVMPIDGQPNALQFLSEFLGWRLKDARANRKITPRRALFQSLRQRRPERAARSFWLEYIYRRSDYQVARKDFWDQAVLDKALFQHHVERICKKKLKFAQLGPGGCKAQRRG